MRGLPDGHVGDLGDVVTANRHGQARRLKSLAMAVTAWHLAQVLSPPGAGGVGLSLVVTTTHVVQHSLVILRVGAHSAEPVAVRDHHRIALAMHHQLARLRGKF